LTYFGPYFRQRLDECLAHEDVVDEFVAPPVLAGEALGLRDAWRQVPQTLAVAIVGSVESGRADLGAGRSVEDLGGGGIDFVVEVAQDDDALGIAAFQLLGSQVTHGASLGGTSVEGVGAVTGTFAFVPGSEAPVGEGQQLGLQVTGDEREREACHRFDRNGEGTAAEFVAEWLRLVGDLDGKKTAWQRGGVADDSQGVTTEEADADVARVVVLGQCVMPGSVKLADEVGERHRIANLLHSQDVRRDGFDGLRECLRFPPNGGQGAYQVQAAARIDFS